MTCRLSDREISKEWVRRTCHPRVLGIQNFPGMPSHTPGPICISEIVNFSKPAIDVDSLVGLVGKRPEASCAGDLCSGRGFVRLDRYAGQDMGRREVTIVLKKLLPFSSQGVFREAVVFIVISVQGHQRIEVSLCDGILSLLKGLQDLVHRLLIGLDTSE